MPATGSLRRPGTAKLMPVSQVEVAEAGEAYPARFSDEGVPSAAGAPTRDQAPGVLDAKVLRILPKRRR